MTTTLKSIIKCEALGLEEGFHRTCLGHDFPKLANMPLVMKKFGTTLNMFPSSLLRHIYKNSSLGHKNLVKASKNGTRLALKLV